MSEIITLNDEQNKALKKAREWWLKDTSGRPFILEGCAGSGKTTVIKFLIEEIGVDNDSVVFCTFTGKAASQLQRKGNNASTIHRLIYNPVINPKTKEIEFVLKTIDEFDPTIKLIVVDEYAMVSDKLMNDLENFERRIILVGDPYQLPPIEKPNKYSILPLNQKDVLLTQPMRQALDSPIIYLANKARNKERIQYGEYGNCSVVSMKDIDIEEFLSADQVIAGKNDTVKKLNRTYRNLIGIKSIFPVKGEKLMFLRNNWALNISENNISTSIINGLFVILESEFEEKDFLTSLESTRASVRPEFFKESKFESILIDLLYFKNNWNKGDDLWKNREKYENIIKCRDMLNFTSIEKVNPCTFGYVCTCYKYQGSEAPNIFFIQEYMGRKIYSQHLYTGITRAQEKVTIVL